MIKLPPHQNVTVTTCLLFFQKESRILPGVRWNKCVSPIRTGINHIYSGKNMHPNSSPFLFSECIQYKKASSQVFQEPRKLLLLTKVRSPPKSAVAEEDLFLRYLTGAEPIRHMCQKIHPSTSLICCLGKDQLVNTHSSCQGVPKDKEANFNQS